MRMRSRLGFKYDLAVANFGRNGSFCVFIWICKCPKPPFLLRITKLRLSSLL